tara:strand:- start:2755 stop:3543 length:789 start_codon:yes stop_codon:yes gene_type:complete
MAKRFIDTKIWDKAWFRKLSTKNKLVWIYLLGKCDHAGIWDADWELAEFIIGETVTYEELPDTIKEKMEYIQGEEQYFIPSFIDFQYGELKENSKPHMSVIKRLNDKNLLKGMKRVTITPKDKDKDKVKEKVKKKDKEKRELDFITKCEKLYKKHDMSKALLKQFTDFWTESNEGGRLMRFEKQQTFDISRRLAKWKSNDVEWNGDVKKGVDNFTSKFKKTETGYYIAYCSGCGKKELPTYEWQLKNGSSCCAIEYLPEKPK